MIEEGITYDQNTGQFTSVEGFSGDLETPNPSKGCLCSK